MKKAFKVGQRVKHGVVRGTVLRVLKAHGFGTTYIAHMDNGAMVSGSKHQFEPVKRVSR